MAGVSLLQISELGDTCRETDEAGLFAGAFENRRLQLRAAASLRLRLPLEHPGLADRFFFQRPRAQQSLDYPLPAAWLHSLPMARLIGTPWAVVSHDHQLLRDTYFNDEQLQQSGVFLRQRLRLELGCGPAEIPFALYRPGLRRQQVPESCFLPVYYWHFNYHHWLLECLPLIADFLTDPRFTACKLLLPARLSAFQQAGLELLGIGPERSIAFDEQEFRCERLFVPTLGKFSPEPLQRLRRTLLQKLGLQPEPRRRLYVSRSDASQRRLLNEADLLPLLQARGFESVNLADMPWRDQISLFSQAAVILGPHGAGLSNALFAPQNSCLIELCPDDAVNHCFWVQANCLDQSYTYLPGRTRNQARDFEIDARHLEEMLDALG